MLNRNPVDSECLGSNTQQDVVSCQNPFDEQVSIAEILRLNVLRMDPSQWWDEREKITRRDHFDKKLNKLAKDSRTYSEKLQDTRALFLSQSFYDDSIKEFERCTASGQTSSTLAQSIQNWISGSMLGEKELSALETLIDDSIDDSEIGQSVKKDLYKELFRWKEPILVLKYFERLSKGLLTSCDA